MKQKMKKSICFAMLALSGSAFAECHLKTGNAVFCLAPKPAAFAYQALGFDAKKANLSHYRQLMQEAGCGRPYGRTFKETSLRLFSKGRVATPDGWVSISHVAVNDSDAYYVATDYIEGVCEPFKPTTNSSSNTLPAG
ncbi:hypothetical protein [Janthinobacterium sp. MDB2-8]|uniref:hypothetical protein n=1 Tax=Janthinobacterium sp. MDB2-8 TaxID=1259338 RepID=UPI003F22A3F7